jgi:hypothetical protein
MHRNKTIKNNNINKNNKIYKNKFRYTRKRSKGGYKLNISKCNPTLKDTINGTCFTKSIVKDIKEAFNKYNPTHIINSTNSNKIINEIKKKTKCNDEKCWLRKLNPHFKINIMNYLYRPKYPNDWKSNKNEWLSNFDILAVLKQYETANRDFKFIGPTFIDFDTEKYKGKCVEDQLCHFNIKDYVDKKITKIGVIFNLDKHTQNGSHWVSLFVDLKDNIILYFNSTGEYVHDEIDILIKRIISQYKELKNIELRRIINRTEHQMGDTECGMYSLFFIISMLTNTIGGDDNKPFNNSTDKINFFIKKRIDDKEMEDLRDKYFIKK